VQVLSEEDIENLIDMPEDQATFRHRIDTSLTEIKTTLTWHGRIGWGLASFYASVFLGAAGLLLFWYLPKELKSIQDSTEQSLQKQIGPLNEKINGLTDSLNRFMALRVAGLISNVEKSRKTPPSKLANDFQQANLLMSAAFKSEVPANPELLIRSRTELRDVLNHVKLPPAVRNEGISTFGHLDAYAAFSQNVLGKIPIVKEAPPVQPRAPNKAMFTATFPLTLAKFSVIDIAHQGVALVFVPPDFHGNVLVYDIRLVGMSQDLSRVKWLDVEFVGSTIEYNGGPLSLENVVFQGCTFKFGTDENSKKALTAIEKAQGKAVTLVSEFL
jgi:hypothetical protein